MRRWQEPWKGGKWDLVISVRDAAFQRVGKFLQSHTGQGLDLPFIIVSGRIGEEIAVEAMKAGARDYLLKDRLTRLDSAIERELSELKIRRDNNKRRMP